METSKYANVRCMHCGRQVRRTTADGQNGLCTPCFDAAGYENAHSDGHHRGSENWTPECESCISYAKECIDRVDNAPVIEVSAPVRKPRKPRTPKIAPAPVPWYRRMVAALW